MNEQPTPYQHPGRRSRVIVVQGAPVAPVTLSPLIEGMVTGTLGKIPLTSGVYAQIPWLTGKWDESIAWVLLDDDEEVLGLSNGHVVRDSAVNPSSTGLPQLILTDGAR